jgi:hypothetical protein
MDQLCRDKVLLWNPTPEEATIHPPDLEIPDEHYAAIGRVTDAWADFRI